MSKIFHSFLVIISFYIMINSIGYSQDERDPFASIEDMLGSSARIEKIIQLPYPVIVQGTMCSENVSLAVINGDIVKEGDRWREFMVEEINRERVILEWKNEKFKIEINFKTEKKKK